MILSLLLALSAQAETLPAGYDRTAPVVVRSDIEKSSAPLVNAPGNFVERDAESIQEKTPDSLKAAIGAEPNILMVGSPRATAELPQIRGLGAERILILDEGVRQNYQSGHNGRIFSDFSLMERIEIVKGPWSSLYGSGAMGGVISFRRSTAEDLARKYGKDTGGELALEGGSNAGAFGQRATGFTKAGPVTPLISYHHLKSGNIKLGDGSTLPFSRLETNDVYSSVGLQLSESQRLLIKLNRFESKSREPLNPERGDTTLTLIGDAVSRKQDVVADYQLLREHIDVHAKPYFRKTQVARRRVSDGRNDFQTVETTGIDSWFNLRNKLSESLASAFTAGAEYFHDRNIGRRGNASLVSFPDGTTNQIGVYVQPQFVVKEKWKFTPGVRVDKFHSQSGGNADSDGKKASFKFYTSYEPRPLHLFFVGWGQAFNMPRLQDLYANGLHFPGGGPGMPNNFFFPNPALRPERANTFETGFKITRNIGEDSALTTNATAFLTQAKDLINRDVNISAGTTYFANIDRSRLYGAEASVFFQRSAWGSGLTYGKVRSRNKVTNQPLQDTPADHWALRAEAYATTRLTVGTDLRYTQAQRKVPLTIQPTGAYYVQDLFLNYNHRPWALGVFVDNVFNRSYRRHFSTNLEEGRDIRGTLTWGF